MSVVSRFTLALVTAHLLACTSDSPDGPGPPAAAADTGGGTRAVGQGVVLATLQVRPRPAAPGSSVTVTVRIPGVTSAQVVVTAAGEAPVTLSPADGGLTGTVTVPVAAAVGDQLIAGTGTSAGGAVRGSQLVAVSTQPACGDSMVPEAGRCVPEEAGSPFELQRMTVVNVQPENKDDAVNPRYMIHPRASVRVGNVLVGCHTDSLGLIPRDEMEDMGLLYDPDFDITSARNDLGGPPARPVVESFLIEGGIYACENIAVAEDLGLALVSSRGDSGRDGGISLWRLPDLQARPLQPAQHVDTVLDPRGIEGIFVYDGLVYAVRNPDEVVVFRIHPDRLEEVGHVVIDGMRAGWHLAASGDRLYVTDPGQETGGSSTVTPGPAGTAHAGEIHATNGGHLFVLDISDRTAPRVLSWAPSSGTAKALAVLPEDVVAVAAGSAGVELFDVRTTPPALLNVVPTQQTSVYLTYDDGYLLVADWDSLILYDASDRGVLRPLGSTDMGIFFEIGALEQELDPEGGSTVSSSNGIFATMHLHLSEGRWVLAEFDAVYTGVLHPGRRAPAMTLHDRRRVLGLKAAQGQADLALRVSNNGRSGLLVTPQPNAHVSAAGSLVIPPSGKEVVEVATSALDQDGAPRSVKLQTNDPNVPIRRFLLAVADGNYEVGDPMPSFRMPIINQCEGAGCPPMLDPCFDFDRPEYEGKVIVLAHFSSW